MNLVPVILTIHVLIVLALIGLVLLQRSEGGALGIGGGGGGLMSGRGAANALTRGTSILAALFFATSLGLAMLADSGETEQTISNELTGNEGAVNEDGTIDSDSLLRSIGNSLEVPEEGESTNTPADPEVSADGTIVAPSLEELEASDPLSAISTDTGSSEAAGSQAEDAGTDDSDPQ